MHNSDDVPDDPELLTFEYEEHLKTRHARRLGGSLFRSPPFIFKNCFRDKSITVITAPAGVGKSTLMLDMALCLEANLPLLGHFPPVSRRDTFFVGADSSSWDYFNLLRKLFIGHNIAPADRASYLLGTWYRGPMITDPDFRNWLDHIRFTSNISVLFIDSHRSTHHADENDSTEMTKVWDILRTMCNDGWCIIMAHHSGRQSDIRGSTIIDDNADFVFRLRRIANSHIKIDCLKGRAGHETDLFSGFQVIDVPSSETDDQGELITGISLSLGLGSLADRILLFLKTGGPYATKDIMLKYPHFGSESIKSALQSLRRSGKAENEPRGFWKAV